MTPVSRLAERHVNVCHLDYGRLGRIGNRVAAAISQDRCRRFRQREIVTLLVTAVRNGRVSQVALNEKVRTEIRAAL